MTWPWWVAGGLGIALVLSVAWIIRLRGAITWSPPAGTQRALALHTRVVGERGPSVVLLHGLAGSGIYFGAHFDTLGEGGRLIVPDLLGFGRSPRPEGALYTIDEHVEALAETLLELGLDRPALIAGHSTGCLVALGLATQRPELVSGVVAFCPPIYRDVQHATARIGGISKMVEMFALETPTAKATCQWMCEHRAVAGKLATLLRPDLPAPIARDGVQHTWASYSGTLKRVVLRGDAATWIPTIGARVALIAGDRDPVTDLGLLGELAEANPRVTLEVWPGDHDLPLRDPDRCVEALKAQMGAAIKT